MTPLVFKPVFFFLLFAAIFHIPSLQSSYLSETNIILIGDSGKNNQGQLDVARSIQDLCQREDCNLGILTGDNVYPVGVKSPSDPILEKVFDSYYNPLNFPFLIALGNHDYGRLGIKWKKGAYQLLHSKKNPLFHLPHYWYVHETPETVFAIIDTSRLMWKKDAYLQGQMVKEAYEKSRAKKKWFMVVGHHPYLSNGPHGNAGRYDRFRFPFFISGKYVKRFLDRHVCDKAHFYLAGHDHSLQVFDGNIAGCNTHLIVSGNAASASTLQRRNQSRFTSLELGFFHLSVTERAVRVRAMNEKTQLLYEESFIKVPAQEVDKFIAVSKD